MQGPRPGIGRRWAPVMAAVLLVASLVGAAAPAGAQPERAEALLARVVELLRPAGMDSVLRAVPTGYESHVRELPPRLREVMTGTSWEPGCPVVLDDLRLLEVVHRDFGGERRWGRLVVHREVADAVAGAFGELHEQGFPIARMHLVDRYGGSDDASMAANNTSAFNCRPIAGANRWSEHSYGRAIDLNPVQNPYVRGSRVEPPAGRNHLDRSDVRPGMMVRPGPVEAFDRIGWGWGGDWSSLKDYQHVSSTGR